MGGRSERRRRASNDNDAKKQQQQNLRTHLLLYHSVFRAFFFLLVVYFQLQFCGQLLSSSSSARATVLGNFTFRPFRCFRIVGCGKSESEIQHLFRNCTIHTHKPTDTGTQTTIHTHTHTSKYSVCVHTKRVHSHWQQVGKDNTNKNGNGNSNGSESGTGTVSLRSVVARDCAFCLLSILEKWKTATWTSANSAQWIVVGFVWCRQLPGCHSSRAGVRFEPGWVAGCRTGLLAVSR